MRPKSEHDLLRARLYAKAGLAGPGRRLTDTLASLRETEWSPEFEQHMRLRLIMGAFRYGKLHGQGKPAYDRVGSAKARLDLYLRTHNQEHLVDAANLLLLEFEEPSYPDAYFESADDGIHTDIA